MIEKCELCGHYELDRFSDEFGYCWLHKKDVKNNHFCSDWSAYDQRGDKSPSLCRHTLEDSADATTELVSGKSSGFIGGMQ